MDHFQPVQQPKPLVYVIGPEGSRKTTFAMSAPGPIYLIGTEGGHEHDTAFRLRGDKEVFATNFTKDRTGDYPQVWFGSLRGLWAQLMDALTELQTAPEGTVVFDSGSDLFGMAAAHFNLVKERGDKPIPPMAYAQVYPLLEDAIAMVRGTHNIVMTVRLKDEWKNEKSTGRQIMKLWTGGEYLADHIIWNEVNKATGVLFAHGTKGNVDGATIAEPTWDKVVQSDYWFGNDDRKLYDLMKKLPVAYAHLDSLGIEYDQVDCTTADEYENHINQLRSMVEAQTVNAPTLVTN